MLYYAKPDENGNYLLNSELVNGTYKIAAGAFGFISDIKTVTVTAGNTTNLDFILSTGAIIKGKVTDESGNPISDVDTWVSIWQDSEMLYHAVPDEQGNYALAGNLPTGTYDVTVGKDGFVSKKQTNVAVSVGQTTILDFVLSISARLQGQVKDISGNLISSCR